MAHTNIKTYKVTLDLVGRKTYYAIVQSQSSKQALATAKKKWPYMYPISAEELTR